VEFETPREYKPDLPFDNVFGTRHEILDEQRAEFLEELKKDAANG
jgi:hypothetical protein